MRRRLEDALQRLWRGETGPGGAALSAALLPLELCYGAAVSLRNRLYDTGLLRSDAVGIPVVSVGNVLVGGAGKTPVAAWLARMLADQGRRPAIVSRGYGRDEVALHRGWNPDVPVFVDADRVRAARAAERQGCGTVILDDGFQHRRLRRDLDIVLHPVEEPRRRRLLPRGPYREPETALRRADHVLLTRRTADEDEGLRAQLDLARAFPGLPVARAHLEPAGWTDLAGRETPPPSGPLLAVTGIARPGSFGLLVERTTGSPVELVRFPDHHEFSGEEMDEVRRRAEGRTVVTTEKDAARLTGGAKGGPTGSMGDTVRVLRLRVTGEAGMDELRRALLDATSPPGAPTAAPDGPGASIASDPPPEPSRETPEEPPTAPGASPKGERG